MGATCVRDTYHRLCPAIIPIRKVTMVTNDSHSAWAKVSFNISKQLAICFGVLDPHTILDPRMSDPLPVSDSSVAGASTATLTLPVVTADGDSIVAKRTLIYSTKGAGCSILQLILGGGRLNKKSGTRHSMEGTELKVLDR